MLDGLYKKTIDRFWNRIARLLVLAGLTPNQVTWIGMAGVAAACLAYLFHQHATWFGVTLAFAFAFDALDGAVARLRNSATRYGGYLDAVLDRYQELLVILAIAYVNGYWIVGLLLITGAFLTSYNKARVAVETVIDNDAWPDLIERLERLVLICAALIFDPWVTLPAPLPARLLLLVLGVLALLTHLTALQRFLRAGRLLKSQP